MSKRVLRTSNNYNYKAIGIASAQKDYRICWFLNESLRTDFVRKEDVEIDDPKNALTLVFSKYFYHTEVDKLNYYVVANKYQGECLLKPHKNADYLLLIQGTMPGNQFEDTLRKVNEIQAIQLVFEIDPNDLKAVEHLILE